MRDYITTITEVLGAAMISIGLGTIFGIGAALISGGILAIAGSVLADMGDNK